MKEIDIPGSGNFKFILIKSKIKYFIFGETLPYHTDIFEKFSQLNSEDFEVCGGGKMSIENKTVKAYGKSSAYGSFDRKTVKEMMEKYCKENNMKLEIE